jgi:hypothetical protein
VVKDEKGLLQFFVCPDWKSGVTDEDRDYLKALLADFIERAEYDSEALMRQLSSLECGPLIVREIGSQLVDYPELLELSATFDMLFRSDLNPN